MTDSTASGSKYRHGLLWILRILLAVFFVSQGLDKFSERQLWLRIFDEIGFGQWFCYMTGVVEVSGAVLLLIPKATLAAVALLAATMLGALLVHVFVIGTGPQTVAVGILLLLLCIIGAARAGRKARPNK